MEADEVSEARGLPSVARLTEELSVSALPHAVLVHAARDELARAREGLARGETVSLQRLRAGVLSRASTLAGWPRRVINATGVVLHTNLGRAPLSRSAVTAAAESAAYSDLEMDLSTGRRGHRDTHVAALLTAVTGAEAATVVNNNAGALVLVLSALAAGSEVVVSRGQSVEIGGRFRIPEVIAQSGAILREVATANRTYSDDYERGCTERTAALLKVHRSNFTVSGFVHEPSLAEMVQVARKFGVPVVNDLGSGCLIETESLGLAHEPTVSESVAAGADITTFSGDKLLGGPQAGLIVGRRELVERIRRHPLMRAMRCDKGTLAALHATLLHYIRGDAGSEIPTLWMLGRRPADLEQTVRRWSSMLPHPGTSIRTCASAVGGGALPGAALESFALVLDPSAVGSSAGALGAALRAGSPAVLARAEHDLVWLDARTVLPEEEAPLLDAVRAAFVPGQGR